MAVGRFGTSPDPLQIPHGPDWHMFLPPLLPRPLAGIDEITRCRRLVNQELHLQLKEQ